MKYTDISTTFSIVKPLFERFSSNLSIVISGYGGLRTFMQTDPKMKGRVEGRFIFSTAGLDHGVGHFQPLSITQQRHLLAYHGIAMSCEGLCQVF